jgi:hypothetical protein
MVQVSFPNTDAVFKTTVHPHTVRSVQCRFEDHEDALQHLPWPAQSQDLNIIEPLWPVADRTVISRVPTPTPLKQPEDVLDGQWYSIPLQTVQNLYKSTARRTQAVSQANGGTTPY